MKDLKKLGKRMGIKFLIGCNKCGTEIEKEISKEGNVFLGIAENGFVIRATETFPLGWKGLKNNKVMCPYCIQGMERPMEIIELICQRCKKVGIIISLGGKNLKEDIDEEIRRVASTYEYVEYEPMKFYCTTCAKEVKSEKIS